MVGDFDAAHARRQQATREILAGSPGRTWRLVFIARVVPIKGLEDFISTIDLLVRRGVRNFHLDVLGPTEHVPWYYQRCVDKIRDLDVGDHLTFHGTVDVRSMLSEFDILVLPSYNEGQPIVALEAMTAGIPIVGTDVGGMAQLVTDSLTTSAGHTWEECGVLLAAGDHVGMADRIQALMSDPERYGQYSENARGRVVDFFQMEDAMAAYNSLYHELGDQADRDRGVVGQTPRAPRARTPAASRPPRRVGASGLESLVRRP